MGVYLRGSTWWVKLTLGGYQVRLSAKTSSKTAARRIEALVRSCLEAKLLGNEVPENVRARLGRTPYIANRLAKLGIVRRVMPARSLLEHLDEYAGTLRSLNRSPQHIQTTIQKCRSIIEWIGAGCFEELEPDEIQRVLAERREARPERFGFGSTNNYIQAIQTFCRWAERRGFVSRDPTRALTKHKADADRRFARRVLTLPDLHNLLTVARAGPAWRGISGEDRYWLYRFLIESCMRPKSVRALTVGDFVLETEPPHVRVAAATHKTGRPQIVPLRRQTAQELQNRFQGLESTDPAFRIPPPWNQAVMLRYDLERAGIAYASPPTADCPRGEQVDLYSLKHTGASLIADVVRSPRELAALVGTTARIAERHYVHLPEIDQIGERLEQLPSLSENLE